MDQAQLAEQLVAAPAADQSQIVERHRDLCDSELAYTLKSTYDDAESNDPRRAVAAADALSAVARITQDPEAMALAAWTAGMAALQVDGLMDVGIAHITTAETQFLALGQPHNAAATQVSKLYALAMLGRYEEAIEVGLKARDTFLELGDTITAGKVENNLGNIYYRRDLYSEAEKYYRTARERFASEDGLKLYAMIGNNLGNALASQHRIRDAAQLYADALTGAESAGLELTQAEVECNLGCLHLYQGHYDAALDYLERSRRRYATLGMPHELATLEQELADAYLELNLAPEAAAIYERVIPTFAELGMKAEQARASAYRGRALLLLGRVDEASSALLEARTLYTEEGNTVGAAVVALAEAEVRFSTGDYDAAATGAARAEEVLAGAGARGRAVLARWLRGDAARLAGREQEARALLESALREAELHAIPQVAQRCHASLGLLASATGEPAAAEEAFKNAISLIEDLRASLPGEEFRTAFVADKLTPYSELVGICLADTDGRRVAEAFGYVERARSRALVDLLSGELKARPTPRDRHEAELLERLEKLREELNWFYSQINRATEGDGSRSAAAVGELHEAVRDREIAVTDVTRQLRRGGAASATRMEPLDVGQLQQYLGTDTALVGYFSLSGELLAFVVTEEGIEVARGLGSEVEAEAALTQLRFQLDTLRHGTAVLSPYMDQLTSRTRHHLCRLYDVLLRPLEPLLGTRRLLVIPHRSLHYVPFHALHDGEAYVAERREVCYVPSTAVLRHCLSQGDGPLRRAVLLGAPGEQIPHVRDEVLALERFFPEAVTLLDEKATLQALQEHASTADVLHLACHGRFRPDNPLFSSLQLADGWLTVRDAYELGLSCRLVVLSACETGVNQVAPGDELMGLARGFFSAGTASLLVSLWAVDDESTASLMSDFYSRLQQGDGPASALRQAQCRLMEDYPHPFHWAPFMLMGSW